MRWAILAALLTSCTVTHTQGECETTTTGELSTITVCKPGGSRTVIRLPLPPVPPE